MKKGVYRLAFLTGNEHKVQEANQILSGQNIELYRISGYKQEIQSDNIEDIAKHAAVQAYKKLKIPLVVEDSGLFIPSLNGFPGPYSSFVYKTIGLNGIIELLEKKRPEQRKAYFKAALACICPPYIRVFTGIVHGKIADKPKGGKGFGFDPIFIPDKFSSTFAELGEEIKNQVSHRARAFKSMATWLHETGLINIRQG
ncbi:MAG: XTP/dITP diphosphatase [Desulfurococcales archaeon]|nr:XTP/dITP diphosphatase [Desulfurococcales archaeon]